MSMNPTMGRARSADWAAESPIARPALRGRRSRGFTRILIAFGVGIFATLAWQAYGDTARDFVARRYPQFAWLAPQAPVTLPTPAMTAPPVASTDPQELKAMSVGLTEVRRRVDQLTVGQDQVTRDIAMQLQAAKQEILDRISVLSTQPAAPPARKPAPLPAVPSH